MSIALGETCRRAVQETPLQILLRSKRRGVYEDIQPTPASGDLLEGKLERAGLGKIQTQNKGASNVFASGSTCGLALSLRYVRARSAPSSRKALAQP